MKKQNMPLARAILSNALENAETLEQAQQAIASALGHMYRRAPTFPVTRAKSQSMTPGLRAQIRQMKVDRPHLSHQEIAEFFNVNSGRVSEALAPPA